MAFDNLASRVVSSTSAAPTMSRLIAHQSSRGTFFNFDPTSGDNPEPWWYHELVATHAVTSFAHLTGDASAAQAAERAAAFHHAETQADHASGQPWAVHAFLATTETIPTAELLLLAATGAGQSAHPGVVSRLILADAAVWLDPELASRARAGSRVSA